MSNIEKCKLPDSIKLPLLPAEAATTIPIKDANGKTIASVKFGENDLDHATYIVRACNYFPSTYAELVRMRDGYSHLQDSFDAERERCEKLEAELQKATEAVKLFAAGKAIAEISAQELRDALKVLIDAVKKDLNFFPDQPHKESALGIAEKAIASTKPAPLYAAAREMRLTLETLLEDMTSEKTDERIRTGPHVQLIRQTLAATKG